MKYYCLLICKFKVINDRRHRFNEFLAPVAAASFFEARKKDKAKNGK